MTSVEGFLLACNEKKPKPSFIVVGAQRCGTTWLHENLNVHPEVFLPEQKEVNYFSDIGGNWEKGFEWYLMQFSQAREGELVGEITPEYLVDPNAATRIYDALGDTKIICIVREPVERAFSSYKKGLRELDWDCSFAEFIENDIDYSVTRGIYYPQIKRYIEVFGEENLLILQYEQIENKPVEFLRRIYGFLEVDNTFFSPLIETSFNVGASSSGLVKLVVTMRNLLYVFPYGRLIFKRFQRTGIGNRLMNWFLKSQALKGESNDLVMKYRHYFQADLEMLKGEFGIEFGK